jgi:hypothetical protein
MAKKTRRIVPFICFVAGLFAIAASNTANAIECFPGPDFKPAPGTRWDYRIDSATNQGCWHIKELGASSRRRTGEGTRSSRSVPASSSTSTSPVPAPTSESAAASGAPRSDRQEETPASAPQWSVRAWFSSTFAPTNFSNAYSTTKTGEAVTSEPSVTPKRYNGSTAPRQRQRSKSDQQTKVAQRKSEGEQDRSARMENIVSILEAAGDKPVLNPPALWGQDLQKAIEAIGDKDVVIAPTDRQEDWQQALYEEFLRWRLRQLIPQ